MCKHLRNAQSIQLTMFGQDGSVVVKNAEGNPAQTSRFV